MRNKPEIKQLIDWLAVDGNSMTRLAGQLGYKTSTTIDKWIKNNRIPSHQREVVLKIIGSEKDVTARQGN